MSKHKRDGHVHHDPVSKPTPPDRNVTCRRANNEQGDILPLREAQVNWVEDCAVGIRTPCRYTQDCRALQQTAAA